MPLASLESEAIEAIADEAIADAEEFVFMGGPGALHVVTLAAGVTWEGVLWRAGDESVVCREEIAVGV